MRIRDLHEWDVSPREATRIQDDLRGNIRIEPYTGKPLLVAGADVHFPGKKALAVVVVLRVPGFELVESVRCELPLTFPYIPGLLTFREGPAILSALRNLRCEPDLFLFDGQGTAHPRRMGLASHIGLLLDRPSLGCAKSRYIGEHSEPGEKRGCRRQLRDKGEVIGAALRTQDGVQPVYVSPGHRMDLDSAIRLVLRLAPRYRVPEPLRLAHHLAGS